eukprot:4958830-Amphidinium_carterae.1
MRCSITVAGKRGILDDVAVPPPGLVQDEEQVPQGHKVTATARAGEEEVSYVDLFYEGEEDQDR